MALDGVCYYTIVEREGETPHVLFGFARRKYSQIKTTPLRWSRLSGRLIDQGFLLVSLGDEAAEEQT